MIAFDREGAIESRRQTVSSLRLLFFTARATCSMLPPQKDIS